jgi:hypothetical protein
MDRCTFPNREGDIAAMLNVAAARVSNWRRLGDFFGSVETLLSLIVFFLPNGLRELDAWCITTSDQTMFKIIF